MLDWLTIDNIEQIEEHYRRLGPFTGLLLPILEAFLPFLPLMVIVIANVNAFGLFWGFFISWSGTVIGSYLVFLIVRRFGKSKKLRFFTESKQVKKLIRWVDMKGISPLFVLLCFPFTPSVLVNIVAGLSNIRTQFYLFVLMLGKLVMIFAMSFVGQDITKLLTSPIKLILSLGVLALLWGVGKLVERHLNKRVERDLRDIRETRKNNKR